MVGIRGKVIGKECGLKVFRDESLTRLSYQVAVSSLVFALHSCSSVWQPRLRRIRSYQTLLRQ